jgi:hypothetical protein
VIKNNAQNIAQEMKLLRAIQIPKGKVKINQFSKILIVSF